MSGDVILVEGENKAVDRAVEDSNWRSPYSQEELAQIDDRDMDTQGAEANFAAPGRTSRLEEHDGLANEPQLRNGYMFEEHSILGLINIF